VLLQTPALHTSSVQATLSSQSPSTLQGGVGVGVAGVGVDGVGVAGVGVAGVGVGGVGVAGVGVGGVGVAGVGVAGVGVDGVGVAGVGVAGVGVGVGVGGVTVCSTSLNALAYFPLYALAGSDPSQRTVTTNSPSLPGSMSSNVAT
jgi:hypothetical protein